MFVKGNASLILPASHLALYFTTPPGIIIIMMLSVVTLWKLPCLAFTKYESGIHIRSITVLLRNMVLLSPWSSRWSVHVWRKKMSSEKSFSRREKRKSAFNRFSTPNKQQPHRAYTINDCRKAISEVITPTNHNSGKQRDEPIKIPANCL